MSAPTKDKDDAKTMPPPPPPETNKSKEPKILQPEFTALAQCLKDAVVKTGQIYSFYADARKLGVAKHVSNPPRSLTAALGRDIEKYDQLCDSIEAQIARAIIVLRRDLRREEQRKEEEEMRKIAEAAKLPPPPEPMVEDPATQPLSDTETSNPKSSPSVSVAPSRRPSAISISSLHRPQFPLKLDLSSTSLRITEEEAALYQKGLASPVTLAPKSARPVGPNEFPAEIMAAFASAQSDLAHASSAIDLTMPDDIHLSESQGLGLGLGDSSDKPIELDLESMDIEMASMNDLFGDGTDAGDANADNDGLFSPLGGDGENSQGSDKPIKQENVLTEFQIDENDNDELFGDFAPNQSAGEAGPSNLPDDSSVPSPGTLLAQFTSSNLMENKTLPSSSSNLAENSAEGFDLNSIDLASLGSEFFANSQDTQINFSMDMDSFLSIGPAEAERKEESPEKRNPS